MPGLPDGLQLPVAWPVATREHEARHLRAGRIGRRPPEPGAVPEPVEQARLAGDGPLPAIRGDGRVHHVLPVAGHDEQAAGTDALDDVSRLHGADGHVLDLAVQVVTRMEQLAGHLLDEHRQRRVGQDGSVGQGAQQADAVPGEALAQHVGQARVGIRIDLVDHGAQDLHAAPREQGMVEHDLIDGPADAGLRDDDRGRAQRSPRHRRWTGR